MAVLRWLLPRHRFCCDAVNDAHVTIGVLQRRLNAAERRNRELEESVDDLMSRLELAEDLLAIVEP